MAYHGQVPGPEIRAREGERLRIVLNNALSEPTTVHWHGVDVPNATDGVPGITQPPVQPGKTFVYEVEARPAGTRWSHAVTMVVPRGECDRSMGGRRSQCRAAEASARRASIFTWLRISTERSSERSMPGWAAR